MRQKQSVTEKTTRKDDESYLQSKKFKNLLIKNEKAIHESRQESIKSLGLDKYSRELHV